LDDALRVTDQESIDMAHWLMKEEGLFVGSSSAMHVFGTFKFVKESMKPGSCVVAVVCDGGERHLTRFWSRDLINGWGFEWPADDFDKWIRRYIGRPGRTFSEYLRQGLPSKDGCMEEW
jgi:cysteine synthase A